MHGDSPRALFLAVPLIVFGAIAVGCDERPPHDASADGSSEVPVSTADRCEERKSPFEQISCFVRVAQETRDPEVCTDATSLGVRLQCFAILAERMDQLELCNRITGVSSDEVQLRDLCISDVAVLRLAPEFCAGLVTPGFRDSCYLKIFRKNGDAALCERIEDPGLRSACDGEPVYQ
jgi:hypothetical protein